MRKGIYVLLWISVVGMGLLGYSKLALHRGESINSGYILMAALCTYAVAYRFYSKWIATKVLMLDERRATPCEQHEDGKDFVRTNKLIVFGHHFAAISGPGPLVGPILAAHFGYLPSTLWILIGVVLGGAVQDFVILCGSDWRTLPFDTEMLLTLACNLSSDFRLLGMISLTPLSLIGKEMEETSTGTL